MGAPSLRRSSSGTLADVDGDAPGLVAGEQLGRRSPPEFILAIDVGERLPISVADDEAGVGLLDGPGRREAARRRRGATIAKGCSHLRGGLRGIPQIL